MTHDEWFQKFHAWLLAASSYDAERAKPWYEEGDSLAGAAGEEEATPGGGLTNGANQQQIQDRASRCFHRPIGSFIARAAEIERRRMRTDEIRVIRAHRAQDHSGGGKDKKKRR